MEIATTKKRRVDPTLLQKWVYIKSEEWIQKESTRKIVSVSAPKSPNCVHEYGEKKSTHWADSFSHFFVFNTGSVFRLLIYCNMLFFGVFCTDPDIQWHRRDCWPASGPQWRPPPSPWSLSRWACPASCSQQRHCYPGRIYGWISNSKFFIAPLPQSLCDVKPKGAARELCAPYCAIRFLIFQLLYGMGA